jgi:phytoene synthase
LWNLDLAFADVVATSSDPRLGAIRLAWWRERLEELDTGGEAPAEPRLEAVARELLPRRVSGKELSQLEDAWQPLLEPFPWNDEQAKGLKLRGQILFGIGARLHGFDPRDAEAAGEIWALEDGAMHCSDAVSRKFLRREALRIDRSRTVPRRLRQLTVLGALALVNIQEPASGVARGMAAVHHRATGRFPR